VTASTRLRLLAPALLLAAACSGGAKLAAAKFAGPSALGSFRGFSNKHPGLPAPRAYLAVANLLRDEITVVDPLDKELVPSSTLAFPLAVPTRPRPFRLAVAPLEAEDHPAPGADLLVVASQSPPSLQVVTTWTEELRAVDLPVEDDLARLYPGSAVLSLAAATRLGGGAWVFVGLSGGHLAVLEFERDPTSTLPAPRRPIRRSALPVQQKELLTGAGRFDPLDLAVAPDASRLFVATTDPLQDGGGATISGVGQLTVVGASASSPWPVVGLDARAPTRLVAAASLAQRTLASAVVFETTPTLQVFAVLAEESCGLRQAINCGLVTLIPDVGIAPDPAGELPYRAPISFASAPTALTVVMPRRGGTEGTPVGISPATKAYLDVATSGTLRQARTALLVVGTAGGTLFVVDPGRWGPVNSTESVEATHRALVNSVATTVSTAGDPYLGLWSEVSNPGAAATVIGDMALAVAEIRFTPGYLPDEIFDVAWRGVLPGLVARRGVLQWDGGPVVAIQVAGVVGAQVADPELGVHVGDRVQVIPEGGTCSGGTGFVATVTAVRPADPTFPGGSLALSHAGQGGTGSADDTACPSPAAVVADSSPGPVTASLTVRAAELVASGRTLGYLGRPQLDVLFELRHQPEAGLSGEELAVNRKLRRRFYPTDPPCGASIPGTEAGTPLVQQCEDATRVPPIYPPESPDPLTPGPMLRFRVGRLGCPASPAPCLPGAGANLTIAVRSGLTSAGWSSPVTRGAATAVTWVDESSVDPARASTVYASFVTDEVLSAVPASATLSSIR